MVPRPIGHRMVHPEAAVERLEWYRSGDADDGDVLAVGAADTVDGAQRADAVGHEQRAQSVPARIPLRPIRRVQFTACAAPWQDASVLELLQQLEVVVAGNAEQVTNAGLLETAKQEISDRHLLVRARGH